MKPTIPEFTPPSDATARRAIRPVICYPPETLPAPDLAGYRAAREGWVKTAEVLVPARDAASFEVPAGHFFRITSIEGPQVGDLNLFSADLSERFYSGKTRALHGTHLSTGDRLWSSFPRLRPMVRRPTRPLVLTRRQVRMAQQQLTAPPRMATRQIAPTLPRSILRPSRRPHTTRLGSPRAS